jgi:putative cell wall-binding protein
MYRKTHRARKAGVAVLVAATALAGFASTAGAATADASDLTLTAQSQPTIGIGKANQPAGNETLTVADLGTPEADTLTAGDQILFTVEDNGGSTCAAGDTLAFSALPTITNSGTATFVATLESSGLGCGTDTIRINVTGSGTGNFTATNIAYTVGATASTGEIGGSATLNGVGINIADASNAFVSSVILTANVPPKGAAATGTPQTISPIVLTEQTNTGADGDLCITLSGANVLVTPQAPTVAVSGGNDTATVAVLSGNQIQVDVTPALVPTAAPSTFTINGVLLDTDNAGLNTAILQAGPCAAVTDDLSDGNTTVGYAGDIDRYAGADRFATAATLFDKEFGCTPNVIIARADLFPDALAASYLAGNVGTGILLTNTNSIPSTTLNALRNEGVQNVYLMGGTTAISSGVESQLDATPAYNCGGGTQLNFLGEPVTLGVQRIAGTTRYGTAQEAAEYFGFNNAGWADINGDTDCDETAPTAIVTSGENFPDALAAGPLAYSGDNDCSGSSLPLLLSTAGSVPSATLDALANLGIQNVVLIGGTTAVSTAAETQLSTAGYNVRRIAGTTRQGTATALATVMMQEFGYDTDGASFARGDNFADALTGGPVSGNSNEAILLTGSATDLSAPTAQFLRGWRLVTSGDQGLWFEVFGGTSAISNAVVQDILNNLSQQ